jgi:hypothetical protein
VTAAGLCTAGGYAARALSLRNIVGSFVAAFIVAVLVGLAWPAAIGPVLVIAFLVVYLARVLNPAQMLKCDACGKRVKMGYTTCHHCGYSRT